MLLNSRKPHFFVFISTKTNIMYMGTLTLCAHVHAYTNIMYTSTWSSNVPLYRNMCTLTLCTHPRGHPINFFTLSGNFVITSSSSYKGFLRFLQI